MHTNTMMACNSILQLRLRLNQVFNLLKPVKEIQTLRVQQRAARLDRLAADNLLDRELDLFAVDGGLQIYMLATLPCSMYPYHESTYRNLWHLKDKLGHMSLGQFLGNSVLDLLDELLIQTARSLHEQE